MQNEFRVRKSASGYGVELCRNGTPYVTLMDGLTQEVAEREARSLMALGARIPVPQPKHETVPEVGKIVGMDRSQNARHIRVSDWT
jgi:hypothetical protein